MAWPNGQQWRAELTVPSAQVPGSGTHANFAVLLTRANLPDKMFDPGGDGCQADGGDIRAGTANDMGTQIPLEVVGTITLDSALGAGDGSAEIWVRVDLNTATDTTFWIAWNTAGATSKESDSGSFGRNAVWVNATAAYHLNSASSATDSAGNYNLSTAVGTPALVSGPWGSAISFSGAECFRENVTITVTNPFSITALVRFPSGVTGENHYVQLTDKDVADHWVRLGCIDGSANHEVSADTNNFGSGSFTRATSVSSVSDADTGWHHAAGTYERSGGSNSNNAFFDGGGKTGASATANAVSDIDRIVVGNILQDSTAFNGANVVEIAEVRIWPSLLSDDWIAAEYNSQSDPAAFVTPGTPSAISSTTTHTITPSGGLELAGAAGVKKTRAMPVAGGLSFGGTAAFVIPSSEHIITPAGGFSFGGDVAMERVRIFPPAGGVSFSGAAALTKMHGLPVSGGLTIAGAAPFTEVHNIPADGGLALSGAAPFARIRDFAIAGGVDLGGSSAFTTHDAVHTITPDGGVTFGGRVVMEFTGEEQSSFIHSVIRPATKKTVYDWNRDDIDGDWRG